jgi:hypothetical protein
MSRGLGETQLAALTELADARDRDEGLFVPDLADSLGVSVRQAHQIVSALRARELVWTVLRGWRTEPGVVGPLVYWVRVDGDEWWRKEQVTESTAGARRDGWGNWCVPGGMPGRGMLVFLGDPSPSLFGPRDRFGAQIPKPPPKPSKPKPRKPGALVTVKRDLVTGEVIG